MSIFILIPFFHRGEKRAQLNQLPNMARLLTTKPEPDDLEIEVDAPEFENNNEENIKGLGNKNITSKNLNSNNNNMTISATLKNKKKLTGTWMKLLSLPPQELVSELKVIFICYSLL